jgi:hypothetical protein
MGRAARAGIRRNIRLLLGIGGRRGAGRRDALGAIGGGWQHHVPVLAAFDCMMRMIICSLSMSPSL